MEEGLFFFLLGFNLESVLNMITFSKWSLWIKKKVFQASFTFILTWAFKCLHVPSAHSSKLTNASNYRIERCYADQVRSRSIYNMETPSNFLNPSFISFIYQKGVIYGQHFTQNHLPQPFFSSPFIKINYFHIY